MNWRREKWLKLYRREEGSFATLPFVVRAIAAQIMKYADDIGCIDTDGKDLVEVIAFRAGATKADRAALRTAIPMLLKDGYLVATAKGVRVRNFCSAQGRTAPADPTDRRDGGEDADSESTKSSSSTPQVNQQNDESSESNATSGEGFRVKSPESLKSGRVVERSREEIRGDTIREDERAETADRSAAPAPSIPPILVFPCSGKITTWGLTDVFLAECAAAFPQLNVIAEMRIALAKVKNGAVRKPTAVGMPRFLMNWLGRSQDRGPTVRGSPTAAKSAGNIGVLSDWLARQGTAT